MYALQPRMYVDDPSLMSKVGLTVCVQQRGMAGSGVRLLTLWHIAVRDVPDEIRIWIQDHDMEMLYRMYRLDSRPVPEPHHLFPLACDFAYRSTETYPISRNISIESLFHEVFDLLPTLLGQVRRRRGRILS